MTAEPLDRPNPFASQLDRVKSTWARTQGLRDVSFSEIDSSGIEEIETARARSYADLLDASWRRIAPQRYHQASLVTVADEARPLLTEWAETPRGRNLILTGPVGSGKTWAALAACRVCHDQGLDVVFAPVVELLDALRPGSEVLSINDLVEADRLIIDDLGTQRDTDWTHERLEAVINRRWMEARPTVVTTNLDATRLRERFRESTFSRLVGGAVGVRLGGADRRLER